MNPKSKRRSIALGLFLTLAIAGLAIAYWTNSGSGTGSATTGDTSNDLSFAQTSTHTNLRPGGAAQAITGDITNNGDETVLVNNISVDLDDTTWVGTCEATDYTISGSPLTVNQSVAAGDDVAIPAGLTIEFNNKPAEDQDDCKTQALVLSYTIG